MTQLEYERRGIDRLVSNRALYEAARARADSASPLVRQETAQLEVMYRIGRLRIIRETLGQATRGFSAITKCFANEHEQRVANFVAQTYVADLTLWSTISRGFCYSRVTPSWEALRMSFATWQPNDC
jgi:hypothetical protein